MERREEGEVEEERKTSAQREQGEDEVDDEEDRAAGRGGDGNDKDSDDEDAGGDEDGCNGDDKDAAGRKKTKQKGAGVTSCTDSKCVPGIIYLGHIPPRLRPKHLRNLLSVYGEIGRIFLQPEGSLDRKTAQT